MIIPEGAKVRYQNWNPLNADPKDCYGVFMQFGLGFQEVNGGAVTFTTAVILKEDGSLLNLPVESVTFIGPHT